MPYDSQSKKEVREVADSLRGIIKDKLHHIIGQMVTEMRISGAKWEHIDEYMPGYFAEIAAEIVAEHPKRMQYRAVN